MIRRREMIGIKERARYRRTWEKRRRKLRERSERALREERPKRERKEEDFEIHKSRRLTARKVRITQRKRYSCGRESWR